MDSDESVKAPPKKKTKQGVLHGSEEEEDDDDDGKDKIKILIKNVNLKLVPILSSQKSKKRAKQTNATLSERRNDLSNRSSMETSY